LTLTSFSLIGEEGNATCCFGIFRCCAKVDKLKDNVEVWHCVAIVVVAIVAAAIYTIVFVHMANIEFTFRQQ